MPMDALCLSLVLRETAAAVVGGRIDKIHQPSRDAVLLHVRGANGPCRLLLSADPARARIALTELLRENPAEPPMFCMLLRKHLGGGRIVALRQPPRERLAELVVEATDELGDRVERRLILELTGRRTNLVLLDGQGRIADCLRRTGGDLTQARPLLPGMFYAYPPAQEGKQDPCALTDEGWAALVREAPPDTPADRFLLDRFTGLSPLIAREVACDAFGSSDAPIAAGPDRLRAALAALLDRVEAGAGTPTLLVRDGAYADFSFRPILQYGPGTESRACPSFAALLDDFYAARETADQVKQKGQDLLKTLSNARDRLARKLAAQERELDATKDRDRYRICGDLITANLYRMQKGERVLRAQDYYDPDLREVEIPLDPRRMPQQNAARYYKSYTKAKTAEEMLTIQLEKGRAELRYLDSVQEAVGRAEGPRDLEEIRQELTETGYLRRAKKAAGRNRTPMGKPMEFRSTAGLRISVGRNNLQNDRLTTKLADRRDLWFHVQKRPGAHVILWSAGQEPDERSCTEAAQLAAWFSQARESGKVAVDYTPVKYVKKPAGSRPGMVVYTTYRTAVVTPDEGLAKRLAVKK